MHGKSSLADGINHQNTHISKHLFAHKTSSTSIELDVDDKRKPMRKRPEEQIEIEGAKSTPTALFFPRGFLTRQLDRPPAMDCTLFPMRFFNEAVRQVAGNCADGCAGRSAQRQDAQAANRRQESKQSIKQEIK